MRRHKKDDDWIGLASQVAGLVLLLCLISPQVRQAISAIGHAAICLMSLATLGLVGFGVYRFATRSQGAEVIDRDIDLHLLGVDTRGRRNPPQTTPDLNEQLRSMDWFQFEQMVALVYRRLGYTVTRRGGANPDGGIDLFVERHGQRFAVQCKQWKTWNVGVKVMREFLGALTDAGIQKGIFITLCGYSGDAKQLAEKHGIEIVNEVGLAKMIESTGAQFHPEAQAILTDTRKFCPKCEAEMVLRTAKKGMGAGRQFWGCSAYPRCRFTMPVS
jgi:HJR/Mrr/RecB family endonuclease